MDRKTVCLVLSTVLSLSDLKVRFGKMDGWKDARDKDPSREEGYLFRGLSFYIEAASVRHVCLIKFRCKRA